MFILESKKKKIKIKQQLRLTNERKNGDCLSV